MKDIKISIIIPVWNVEKYLDKCLNSILNQKYNNFEIILVDDESTDNSIKMSKEYEAKDNRIKFIQKKHSGLGNTRNIGIKEATGDYLFFVDSDDFIASDTLEKMIKATEDGTKDLVICDYYKYMSENDMEYISIVPFQVENKNQLVLAMPTASCKLIKRKFFQDILFPENIIFEDNAVMPYIISKVESFNYLREAFYYYVQREGSILNKTKYNKRWEEIFLSLDNMLNLFKKNGTYLEFYAEIEYMYIEYLLHASSLKFYKYEEGQIQIEKIGKVMKENFPHWKNNRYLEQCSWKYKLICKLFYKGRIKLIKFLLRG